MVTGFPAFAVRSMLAEVVGPQLRRLVELGTDPRRVEALARCWASIRRAADEWVAAERAETAGPDLAVLSRSTEISTADAALALDVSQNRVRQLCRAHRLRSRRDRHGRWWVDVTAVREHMEV